MKQVYVSNNQDGTLEHDYDLLQDGDKIQCLYSRNSEWNEHLHGKKAGSIKLTDDGNVIKIGDQKMKLDFADLQVLKILLLADTDDTDYFEIRESKTIKKWPKGIGTEESLR